MKEGTDFGESLKGSGLSLFVLVWILMRAVEVLTATRLQRRASDVTDPSDPCQPHLGVAGRPARPGEVM
jgi:hypothetical protein